MQKTIVYICGFVMMFVLGGCAKSSLEPSQFESYKNACEQGDGDKCYSLGRMYMEGNGTNQSYSKAREAYKQGCEKGNNADACREFGKLQSDGLGVRSDDDAVKHRQTSPALNPSQFESYKIACEQGDGDKCYSLGRMYMEGNGTNQSYSKAREAYKRGCEQRSYSTMEACYALGKIYANGLGVGRNYNKAQKLFEHTCKASDTKGCGDLGHMYLYGNGVKKNYSQAIKLLKKGCEHNDAKACSTLGTLYITGQVVKEDYKKAYGLFDKACHAGDALGCYNMGNIYENGIGRAQSKHDAIHFYNLACSAGLQEGCQSLKLLQ